MRLKWEWETTQHIVKWKLVEIEDNNKKKVIGTVISIQIWSEYWDVEATCAEIGYNRRQYDVYQHNIRKVVLDHKKAIQEGVEKKRLEFVKNG